MKHGKWWIIKSGQDLTGIYRWQGKREQTKVFKYPLITLESNVEGGVSAGNYWESVRYFKGE